MSDSPKIQERREKEKIKVNIGGVKFVLRKDVLYRYPKARLAMLLHWPQDDLDSLCDDYDDEEFFFDRDPEAFKCILEFYHSGQIHMKCGMCALQFSEEMDYWGVDPIHLDECCSCHLNEIREELAFQTKGVQSFLDDYLVADRPQSWKIYLWKLLERPQSSVGARVVSVVSLVFVLLSTVVMCAATVPELQVREAEGHLMPHPVLEYIEMTCIIWFTAEYVPRLLLSANKCAFVFALENIVDLLIISPFYLVLILKHVGTEMAVVAQVQRAVQVFHVLRIFRFVRYSEGLQCLGLVLKKSLNELWELLVLMSFGTFLFSMLGYWLEKEQPESRLNSISQCIWWTINTMTTVGSGDVYPTTILGMCTAAVICLCGIIIIARPAYVIASNWNSTRIMQQKCAIANKCQREIRESQASLEVQERALEEAAMGSSSVQNTV